MNTLIIGASRGIGLELVRQYRAEGHAVTGTARDASGLQRLSELGARAVTLDVTAPEAAGSLAATLGQALSGMAFDTVVINAGVYGPRLADGQAPTAVEFDEVMHTNVWGPMRALPVLREVLAPGARLAVISSRMGSMGLRSSGNAWLYRASKAAVNSVLKDASLLWHGKAICVALHPGWVRTDMGGAGADLDVAESVAGIRRTLAGLSEHDNGGFFNYDGSALSW